jgi:hypothetical protein
MAIREFTDESGHEWVVWEVQSAFSERRHAAHREIVAAVGERRMHESGDARVRISSHLAHGWLVFESRHERRRLTPVPPQWATLSPVELAALVA